MSNTRKLKMTCKPEDELARIDACSDCKLAMIAAGFQAGGFWQNCRNEFSILVHAHHLKPGVPVPGLASDHDFDSAGPGTLGGRVCCHLADCREA